jgi:hypothetical protein
LQKGILINEKEMHDHYSTSGCTIKGVVRINGKRNEFVYDYGGIIHFSNGIIIGCGEDCCTENYPNCSWDKHNLREF